MNRRAAEVVLVLEDSDEDFDTLLTAVKRMTLQPPLLRAKSGEECLRRLRGEGREPLSPAFLLLDLNTPGLDGRDTLQEIKGDARLRSLPVVVLSTSPNPRDLELCYRRGANAYHVKPVHYPEHLDILCQIFSYWLSCARVPARAG